MAPPEGPRGKRRAAAPTTPAPRRPGTWGAGGPAEGGAEEESRRRDRRASAPAPARPGEAGPAENCVEERARGQLMLDLVSKNGNRDSKTHRFSSLLPPLLIVASILYSRFIIAVRTRTPSYLVILPAQEVKNSKNMGEI